MSCFAPGWCVDFGQGYLGQIFGEYGLLSQIGFYTYILPFLIVFGLSYAAMRKFPVFGSRDMKNITAVISMAIALYVTIGTNFLIWYKNFTQGISQILAVLLVIILFFIIIYTLLKGFEDKEGKGQQQTHD